MAPVSPSSSHKPRRRKKNVALSTTHTPVGGARKEASPNDQRPPFPLASFLWPARGGTSQWIILPLTLMFVGLYRWGAGFWGYSGFKSPPMHGDFEAQRHWMEVTLHLPVTQWYFHDLEWWGLDYPPLTAYHSWFMGTVGSVLNPAWFALHTSRGLDDPLLKVFMRATVLLSEYLIYMPAVILFCRQSSRAPRIGSWELSIALVAVLMQPATILIDHAHFQYNTVMLGFVVASMFCMVAGSFMWSCVFFVLALSFKQMALYYAPAVFAYLLGSCIFPRISILRLTGITIVTVASFALVFAPFILGVLYDWYVGSYEAELSPPPPMLRNFHIDNRGLIAAMIVQLSQSIHRIFPFARGLFEDKVANFWCSLHTFHKLHRYSTPFLQRISLAATLIAIFPPCLLAFFNPRRSLLLYGFAATAWGFFLFSFQVHEKSVLLPLLPMTLLLCGDGIMQPATRAWVSWANILGTWTMFPLLKRDQLRVPYFVLTSFWAWLMGIYPNFKTPSTGPDPTYLNLYTKLLHGSFYFVMAIWHLAEAFIPPPTRKPDLWVVANVLVGAAGFAICYLWCLWRMWLLVPSSDHPPTPSSHPAKARPKFL